MNRYSMFHAHLLFAWHVSPRVSNFASAHKRIHLLESVFPSSTRFVIYTILRMRLSGSVRARRPQAVVVRPLARPQPAGLGAQTIGSYRCAAQVPYSDEACANLTGKLSSQL